MENTQDPDTADTVQTTQPEAVAPSATCSAAPLTLWLQWYGDSDESETGPVAESEVTHCREKVFPRDIEYIDARAARKALDGHPSSELLGDGGLIAATMRSARMGQRLVMVKVVGGDVTEGTITIKVHPKGFVIGDTISFLCPPNDKDLARRALDSE